MRPAILLRFLSILAFAAAATGTATADTFPVKPVRLVVHNNPGSALDLIARQVSQRLSDGWKQPVVIDNRPGGGGIVGADAVAKAAPDGYTLFAPAGTPPAVQDKLTADTARVLADPTLRSQLAAQGISATGYTGARLQNLLAAEARRYEGLVRSVGIRGD